MKRTIGLLVVVVFALSAFSVSASDIAVQINGVSRHQGECTEACNEDNEGFGVEVREDDDGSLIDVYAAGTLMNSMSDRSYYAGMAKAYRVGRRVSFSAGAFLGLVYYPTADIDTNGLVPAILPFASLDLGGPRVNALYIPPITDKVVGAWFFQMAIPIYTP